MRFMIIFRLATVVTLAAHAKILSATNKITLILVSGILSQRIWVKKTDKTLEQSIRRKCYGTR